MKYVDTLSFGKHCTLQSGIYVYGSRYVAISAGCMLLGDGGISLGDFTHLGLNVVATSQCGDKLAD